MQDHTESQEGAEAQRWRQRCLHLPAKWFVGRKLLWWGEGPKGVVAGCVAPVRTRSLFSSGASDSLYTQSSWPSYSRAGCKGHIGTTKAGEDPKPLLSEQQAGFPWELYQGVYQGTRRQEETLHWELLLTWSNNEAKLFVWHFQSLLHVYIKKGQPRLWAQTEGAQKWLIRVYMKHQLMTGTQGASIMLLPWELQLRSHICLCIHRLPLVFFPFPRHCSLPWCHASSWERTPLLSMLDYMRLRRWEGRGETSRSALYFKVDQTHAENCSPFRAKNERFSSFAGRHMWIWRGSQPHQCEKHWCHWYLVSPWPGLPCRQSPAPDGYCETHSCPEHEQTMKPEGETALCPSPAWAPQT